MQEKTRGGLGRRSRPDEREEHMIKELCLLFLFFIAVAALLLSGISLSDVSININRPKDTVVLAEGFYPEVNCRNFAPISDDNRVFVREGATGTVLHSEGGMAYAQMPSGHCIMAWTGN